VALRSAVLGPPTGRRKAVPTTASGGTVGRRVPQHIHLSEETGRGDRLIEHDRCFARDAHQRGPHRRNLRGLAISPPMMTSIVRRPAGGAV